MKEGKQPWASDGKMEWRNGEQRNFWTECAREPTASWAKGEVENSDDWGTVGTTSADKHEGLAVFLILEDGIESKGVMEWNVSRMQSGGIKCKNTLDYEN
jgi:hypothetical protein